MNARRGVFAAAISTAVLVIVTLPASTVRALRIAYPWLSGWLGRLERLSESVDVPHVVLFVGIGFCARLLFLEVSVVHLSAGLVLLSVITEVLQFFSAGRAPKLADVCADIIGAAIGLALAAVACRMLSHVTRAIRSR